MQPTSDRLQQLRAAIKGNLITAAEPGYDKARTVMYGGNDKRPLAIVKVAGAADVTAAIAFARETGLELAVRSGGHSGAGHSTTEGGLVIDVRDLNTIEIDPATRTAWAGAGATAEQFTKAAAEHKLAVGFGDAGSVGLSGIALGGGVGFLVRKFGLTIDSLLAAEIVTANGEILTIDAENHPDLFWAIRGGGGNFGVITRLKLALHDLPEFTGGMMVLPATAETIAGFVAASAAAPDELSTIANVMPAPPMPFLPEDMVGKTVILAFVAYAGSPEDGKAAIAPIRALATPLADFVQPMPLPGMYQPEDPDYHPTAAALTLFADSIDRDTAEVIVDALNASDASMRVTQIRVLGGASARVPEDATAYAHRKAPIMINVAAFYDGEADMPARQAWVNELSGKLNQTQHGAYVNFLGDEGQDRIRAAYPGGTWDRLRKIKARYDPENVFRLNQNIPPAA